MKRILFTLTAAASLLMLASCGGKNMMYSSTTPAEAGTLKNFCEQNNIASPEVRSADSLFSLGNVKMRQGARQEAYANLDLAVIYYRLALSKEELRRSQGTLDQARNDLATEEEQLATYLEVLHQLKGGAK